MQNTILEELTFWGVDTLHPHQRDSYLDFVERGTSQWDDDTSWITGRCTVLEWNLSTSR